MLIIYGYWTNASLHVPQEENLTARTLWLAIASADQNIFVEDQIFICMLWVLCQGMPMVIIILRQEKTGKRKLLDIGKKLEEKTE